MRKAPSILVADDEVDIASFVAEALRDEGYSVRNVHDGASALLVIQSQPPDLVLLDNAMPVMTGVEVLQRIRAQGMKIPIIIMSANARGEQFLPHGATAFLPKPFPLDALLQIVAEHVGSP